MNSSSNKKPASLGGSVITDTNGLKAKLPMFLWLAKGEKEFLQLKIRGIDGLEKDYGVAPEKCSWPKIVRGQDANFSYLNPNYIFPYKNLQSFHCRHNTPYCITNSHISRYKSSMFTLAR